MHEGWYWLLGLTGVAALGVVVVYKMAPSASSPSDTAGATGPTGVWEFTLVGSGGDDQATCLIASSIASVPANQQQINAWAKARGFTTDWYSGTSNATGVQTLSDMNSIQVWVNTQVDSAWQ
jgi:hypothetical protein